MSTTQAPTVVTDLPSGKDITVFGAGDYFTKNGHLYFITDYCVGGFVVENCETLFSHPVGFEFVQKEVKWIARDSSYKRSKPRRGE